MQRELADALNEPMAAVADDDYDIGVVEEGISTLSAHVITGCSLHPCRRAFAHHVHRCTAPQRHVEAAFGTVQSSVFHLTLICLL